MPNSLPPFFSLSPEVLHAQSMDLPLVALESTVITHGLPHPENLQLAQEMEEQVRSMGAVPATVAVLEGRVCVGLSTGQLASLADQAKDGLVKKISTRDFASAVAHRQSGGTTVAATMAAASMTGIRVFATGGIGGVHRDAPQDISADLDQLARTPMVVVCAGAKAILDIPGTLERLETFSVPVIGYQTDEYPAFYSRSSGYSTSGRADSPEEVASIARTHWEMGLNSAVLVTVPLPEDQELPRDMAETAIQEAMQEVHARGIHGQEVTPYLLSRVSQLTKGASMRANLALLHNNAHVAAQIARYLYRNPKASI